jgi:signal transduction histidine kinase
MKPARELEPGVLPTFRLFIGMQLVISALGAIAHWLAPFQSSSEMATQFTVLVLESGLLFLYLSVPALQRTLGSFYLPIGIVWAAAGPMAGPYLQLHATGINVPVMFVELVLWQQIILLFIPLVVISWQYSIRMVILFCALTTARNVALLSQTLSYQEMISHSLLGVIFIPPLAFLLVGNMIANLMKVQREQRQRLAQYASTLEQLTISRERNRLARELHDVLAHTLSGVAVELEGLRTMLRLDPERAQALLSHSLTAIREGLTETRRALQELRAKPLEDLGLALAVRALAESYSGRFDFRIDLNIDHDLGDYPIEVQQCVYRIAEEALANVANHAQADHAQVVLKRDRGQLHLIIRDDGCGFDPSELVCRIPGEEYQYGLLGMRERAEMISGSLSVASQVGKGTQVSFSYGGSQ